ncbi:MAG: hypothetical protein WA830_15780 [Candidatus Sulfotelmatobacter sp.]
MNRGFSLWGIPCTFLGTQKVTKESVPQFPRRRFHADMFLSCVLRDVIAVAVELQVMLASQVRYEFLIGIGFGTAQFVIEVNHRQNDAEFVPQLEQQPQQADGINSAGYCHADAVPGPQQFVPPNMGKRALRQ